VVSPDNTFVVRHFCTWLGLLGLIAVVFNSACSGPKNTLRMGHPPISIGGYHLTDAPSSDPSAFLGRRYTAHGESGDVPCSHSDVSVSDSHQVYKVSYNRAELSQYEINARYLFGGHIALDDLEHVEILLDTSRRAFVTLGQDCEQPVVFDALAGTLSLVYRLRRPKDVDAAVDAAKAFSSSLPGRHQLEVSSDVVRETYVGDEYVAIRVNRPDTSRKRGITLLLVGSAIFAAGLAADHYMARDGVDGRLEWAPPSAYGVGSVLVIAGYLNWRRPR
jgi:hypothetical protein